MPGRGRTPGAPEPSPEALARAKARLSPPPAPWHPLPLAELGIVFGIVAAVISGVLVNRDGVIAGFALIALGTAEFSWREHRHGFRSHGAVLAGLLGFAAGTLGWRVIGLSRDGSLGLGIAVFLVAWGLLDRSYVPASRRNGGDSQAD